MLLHRRLLLLRARRRQVHHLALGHEPRVRSLLGTGLGRALVAVEARRGLAFLGVEEPPGYNLALLLLLRAAGGRRGAAVLARPRARVARPRVVQLVQVLNQRTARCRGRPLSPITTTLRRSAGAANARCHHVKALDPVVAVGRRATRIRHLDLGQRLLRLVLVHILHGAQQVVRLKLGAANRRYGPGTRFGNARDGVDLRRVRTLGLGLLALLDRILLHQSLVDRERHRLVAVLSTATLVRRADGLPLLVQFELGLVLDPLESQVDDLSLEEVVLLTTD
mmetsp:Transcript_108626/g.315946  ORF Transcript_108626/g.315946 Transcript_108626/m.315946 type:complete len:280 (-) Transcript_108626:377-1216(-)